MASEAPSKDADYRDVGTKMGESGVKGFAYGCILGLFLANWRETSGKGATARAVAAQGPEAVRAYMWNARAQMAGTVAKYGAFMGAASAAYVAGKGIAETVRGKDDPLNAALGAQAMAALFGVAFKSNRVLAATSIGMGGGMYAFDWLRRARDAGYENGLPGLAVAAEPAHRQR
mmetsp:Transcript_3108/g.12619  ORF Transcript_3108/g.12619 Transcript_3108/m.12619 type:complete len:174 (-) Transcript_3108:105-626(-)|eukprot:PRCOL_00000931-RA